MSRNYLETDDKGSDIIHFGHVGYIHPMKSVYLAWVYGLQLSWNMSLSKKHFGGKVYHFLWNSLNALLFELWLFVGLATFWIKRAASVVTAPLHYQYSYFPLLLLYSLSLLTPLAGINDILILYLKCLCCATISYCSFLILMEVMPKSYNKHIIEVAWKTGWWFFYS